MALAFVMPVPDQVRDDPASTFRLDFKMFEEDGSRIKSGMTIQP
jgi:hypothetical protein